MYWPPVVMAIALLLAGVQSWWAMFGLRLHTDWNFIAFAIVVAQVIAYYLLAALVLPDFFGDALIDLRQYYYEQRRWSLSIAIALFAISIAKDFVLGGRLPEPLNLNFHLGFIAICAVGIATRNEWYHKALVLSIAIGFCVYIGVLFVRLS
jgi:hypothetical protein